jgi:hypothetical protein
LNWQRKNMRIFELKLNNHRLEVGGFEIAD